MRSQVGGWLCGPPWRLTVLEAVSHGFSTITTVLLACVGPQKCLSKMDYQIGDADEAKLRPQQTWPRQGAWLFSFFFPLTAAWEAFMHQQHHLYSL